MAWLRKEGAAGTGCSQHLVSARPALPFPTTTDTFDRYGVPIKGSKWHVSTGCTKK